ncbi:hypothetical protein A2773_06080 [Candidatus Gottesmanbacteria bacterium RIFCSPHIGHO2_01_FULL_39_10]|uniref:Glycosyl transferase family 1 domain-containing protein n=1 Tax=Candidatus Gottesmanbacteria bacterium RIFCSPHIGHO2_01_FULL_39_10 TaxID=1798375 RepID=A0A1F5ZMQ4_9BACT|nr:MAG: hypothetical protein A2773_06080 [Candidatus Gottesmanbacteria bacterium RIFCSPHIGHO2_01_FULL_39_10]
MKIALVHDYIKEYGGAERVLEALHEIWPEAPVYTTVYLPEFLGPHKERFKDWKIVTSWMQKIPFVGKLISPMRVISPKIFEGFDFSPFDAVIVSATGAYFPNSIRTSSKTIHICYCHTPPRYLYGYPTARDWKKHWWGRVLGEVANHFLRQTDFLSYQKPKYIIANSMEVKRRIEKFYRRESFVIYPPVEMGIKKQELRSRNKRKYYLAGGRLARAKRIDLAIEACNRLKLPLKVFGKGFGDYGEELKNLAGPTVEFVGEVSDSELLDLYEGAKALLFTAEYEDFGIMSVEAQSQGVPVIGLNQGGVKETVVDGKTGVLYKESSVDDLVSAIKRLEKLDLDPKDFIENANKFNKERFKNEIKKFVESHAGTS